MLICKPVVQIKEKTITIQQALASDHKNKNEKKVQHFVMALILILRSYQVQYT